MPKSGTEAVPIEVVRGQSADLDRYVAQLLPEKGPALILPPTRGERRRSWQGVLDLLSAAVEHLGAEAVDAALRRHIAAASLLIESLAADLTPEQRQRQERMAARSTSHLSHNWAIQRPLFEAWAALLNELLGPRDVELRIPDAAALDWETLAVLKALYRSYPQQAPPLVLGVDYGWPYELDGDGILWPVRPEYLLGAVAGFQMLPGAVTRDLEPEEPDGPANPHSQEKVPKPFGEDLETRARAMLGSAAADLTTDDARLALAAVRGAFRRFGFTSCLHLGLELLRRDPPLDRQEVAEVHGLVALSAHNRQFRTAGNETLARFIESHLGAALEGEERPADRCALLYRLAVTCGRRLGDLDRAARWADQAVEEAGSADLPPVQAAHLEAWARNIRAYVRMRQKQPEEAITDSLTAFERLESRRGELPGEPPYLDDAWPREYIATQSLLAFNMAALYALTRDIEQFVHWQRVAHDLEEGYPGVERFEASNWISYFRAVLRLDLALEKAQRGLESARREHDAQLHYRFLLDVADLHYRRGEPQIAYELYRQEMALRERFNHPGHAFQSDLLRASAARRAGLIEEARKILRQALDEEIYQTAEAQTEILTELGRIAAQERDGDAAEHWMNQAIDLAVESGERDVLLRVVTAAGEACLGLDRREEALQAFRQGLEIAEVGDDEAPPLASDRLPAVLGLLECGELVDIRVAVKLLPAALQASEAWWCVPRLLPHLTAAVRLRPDLLDTPELARPLAELVEAAGQRQDCSTLLDALRTAAAGHAGPIFDGLRGQHRPPSMSGVGRA